MQSTKKLGRAYAVAAAVVLTGGMSLLAACGGTVDTKFSPPPDGGAGGSSSSSSSGEGGGSTGSSSSASSSASSSGSTAVCGNDICEPTESFVSCPPDCPAPCAHTVCEVGDPLDADCDHCVATVCLEDDYCCSSGWDNLCIAEADDWCGAGCCGNGACEGQTCDACPADCGACVCGDGTCEGESCDSCPADCGLCATCPHTVCSTGSPLSAGDCREPCVAQVCAQQPDCCADGGNTWTVACQQLAATLCGADPCVQAVCAQDASCCTSGWAGACVAQAVSLCATSCSCSHDLCTDGDALSPGCDPCVQAVCTSDQYCCDTGWDGICVGEVSSICGISCS